MIRLIYLLYYIKKTPFTIFIKFLNFVNIQTAKSRYFIIWDCIKAVYKQNISLLDYFYFKFYDKDEIEREKWAGTGFMYEYQLKMNPIESRSVLEDKRTFLDYYQDFLKHDHVSIDKLKANHPAIKKVLNNPTGKIVFKDALGQCGQGIKIDFASNWTQTSLITYMDGNGFNLLESFVQQDSALQKLSPTGLNTVRIITQLDSGNNVIILGCRLRISVNSKVDNMASGNLAGVIDSKTGVVISNGFFSDITKQSCPVHPMTDVSIIGFQIPYWNETLDFIHKVALKDTRNRSVGWDIAITNNGPDLIEGNHNWCKLLWQLPEQKGLKHSLEPYL